MFELESLQKVFSKREPIMFSAPKDKRASVALVLSGDWPTRDPRIIFIKRAFHDDDPWSGHMALPGGRFEEQDRDLLGTARRETEEEIGIDLLEGKLLGRLDDIKGKHGSKSSEIVISSFVFQMPEIIRFVPNREVADVVTLQVSRILDPTAHTTVSWTTSKRTFPGIAVGTNGRIIWGLTYRVLRQFFYTLGHVLPPD